MSSDKSQFYDPNRVATADVIGSAGDPVVIEIADGTKWKVGFPTQRAKDRYEKFILAYEQKLVLRQKAILEQDDFQARVDKLAEQIEGRQFATGGAMWLKHSGKPHGWLMWLKSLFAEHHKDISDEQVKAVLAAEPEQVRLALVVVIPPFLAWVARQFMAAVAVTGDPQLKAKAEEGLVEFRTGFAEMFPDINLDPKTPSA